MTNCQTNNFFYIKGTFSIIRFSMFISFTAKLFMVGIIILLKEIKNYGNETYFEIHECIVLRKSVKCACAKLVET